MGRRRPFVTVDEMGGAPPLAPALWVAASVLVTCLAVVVVPPVWVFGALAVLVVVTVLAWCQARHDSAASVFDLYPPDKRS